MHVLFIAAHDYTAYAEHIKFCTNESTDKSPGMSADDKIQSNLSKMVKNCQSSYVCHKCLVPTGSPRSLLLHLQDVHGEDMQIFICRFCSRYAARLRTSVYKHAMRKHRKQVLKHRSYAKILQNSVNNELSMNNDVCAGEDRISKAQATFCIQSENNILHTEQYAVKSSSSLGLQFIGKQHPAIGREEYFCKLCSFSHVSYSTVVKHIWKDHDDKFSEMVLSEASARQTSSDVSNASILYKCDECSYTTNVKFSLYSHYAHHQFEGPSKCPHCSFCALTDAAIVNHVRKYHESGDLMVKHSDPKLESVCSKTAKTSYKVAKGSKGRHKKQYARRHVKKWYSCPYCSFKSQWYKSVHHHKQQAHAKLGIACRKRSSVDTVSPDGYKVMKMDVSDAPVNSSNSSKVHKVKMDTSGALKSSIIASRAEQQNLPSHKF